MFLLYLLYYTAGEAAFLDLHLSISNDIVSTKIYDKRDVILKLSISHF